MAGAPDGRNAAPPYPNEKGRPQTSFLIVQTILFIP